jgi:predicted TIM-barrel fold metal-dependent hydrolase
MNAPLSSPTRPAILHGFPIVDADTHVTERHDLWTSRAPLRFRDRVPQVKTVDGKQIWTIDGDKSMGTAAPSSTIRKDGSKASGAEFLGFSIEDVLPASYDVKARVAHMGASGVAAQIAYPNVLGFGGQKAMMVDPELRLLSTQIFNDAMAEMQAESGDRIFPMALAPWWNVKEAMAEIERCHAMGLRGVNTNSEPHTAAGVPDMGDDYWTPFWDMCSDLEMPINFHIGASDESMSWWSSGSWPSHTPDQWMAYGSTLLYVSNARVLTNIILSRFLERFPRLKIVSVESGVGWLPFLLEALEYQMQEARIPFNIRPIDLFRRQIYACCWFEKRDIVETGRALGIDNILFETDFPHPTCLYPDVLGHAAETAAHFTPEERGKVFGGNAIKLYNLPAAKWVQ